MKSPRLPSTRIATPRTIGIFLASALTLSAHPAHATGMQGHMYVTELAIARLPDGDLRTLLEARRVHWLNGSFLPDSGYAAGDAYGEMAHWEEFVEAYIQWIRSHYDAPFTGGAAADHVAVLMGSASHSMVDQVFDALFQDRAEQLDGSSDDLDTGIDTWLVIDKGRTENPEVVVDTAAISDVFQSQLGYDVSAATIAGGMDTAKMGIGAVISVLSKNDDAFRAINPWAAGHYLDAKVPGAYPHCARVASGYLQNVWERLQGNEAFGDALIGAQPEDGGAGVAVDPAKIESRVTLFFGRGLARDSVTGDSVRVEAEDGTVIPTDLRVRGDTWVGTVQLTPRSPWDYRTRYVVRVTTGIETLHGSHPAEDLLLSFTTECAPGDEAACAEPSTGGATEDSGCSCRAAGGGRGRSGWAAWVIAGMALAFRRRGARPRVAHS